MSRNYSSTAVDTTLTSGVSAANTSLTVAATTGFPAAPFVLAVGAATATQELVLVTAVGGLTLTVTRGYDSTVAAVHETGAAVSHSHAAIDFRDSRDHERATTGVHGVTGNVVGTTDSQTLTNKTATTPATSDNDTKIATTAFVKAALLAANPVGTIYMTTVDTNPSTFIGGTWVAWGSGRVPVGVDVAQTEFDTAEETGGAKTHTLTAAEMPSHTHLTSVSNATAFGTSGNGSYSLPADSSADGVATSSAGSGGAHNNLQPYITCYMFKRTA